MEQPAGRGVISEYSGKVSILQIVKPKSTGFTENHRNCHFLFQTNLKAPFGCAYVASGHSHAVLSVCVTNSLLFTASKGAMDFSYFKFYLLCCLSNLTLPNSTFSDRSVKVWDLECGMEIQSMTGHPNNVEVVRYCESSRLLFSVSSAYVKVWDLRESPSRCIKTLW